MPPRVRQPQISCPRRPSTLITTTPITSRSAPFEPSPCPCQLAVSPSRRPFSTTPRASGLKMRQDMFRWLKGPGENFRQPVPGSTNYLSAYDAEGNLIRGDPHRQGRRNYKRNEASSADTEGSEQDAGGSSTRSRATGDIPPGSLADMRPFPNNRYFVSQPVLSEALREEIFQRVVVQGKTIKIVSAELGVEMNRVGAVVRLMTLEKDWEKKGKKLTTAYSRAVLGMLPQTPYNPEDPVPHESINDLPIHPATGQQLFYPTAESRTFTRVDAARAFHPSLLPADARIPHPELVELERERLAGVPREERVERARARIEAETQAREKRERYAREREARDSKAVIPPGGRWEFRFREYNVEHVGADGRSPRGVGWRYGFPHEDRKKGHVKIPTSVG